MHKTSQRIFLFIAVISYVLFPGFVSLSAATKTAHTEGDGIPEYHSVSMPVVAPLQTTQAIPVIAPQVATPTPTATPISTPTQTPTTKALVQSAAVTTS